MSGRDITRRWFVASIGSAAVATGFLPAAAKADPLFGGASSGGYNPTLWYEVRGDGRILIHVTRAEMGQHIGTALARVVAEELEARWDHVEIVHVDTDPRWGVMITGGSWSVHKSFDQLSRAGAAGRIALLEAGARMLGVPAKECDARDSEIRHISRSIGYADIVASGEVTRQFTEADLALITLKPASERRLLNHDTAARDVPSKVNGTAVYGIDRKVDGMVLARPVLPPTRYGNSILSWDDTAARKLPGYLRTVVIDDPTRTCQGWLVAVAESWPIAAQAADLVEVRYKSQGGAASDEQMLAEGARLIENPNTGGVFHQDGDPLTRIAEAREVHEGLYRTHTALHMHLEPLNALAWQDGKTWRVHAGNQWQSITLPLVAKALGISQADLVFETSYLGGGFGRRLYCEFIVPAALAAKAMGRPVKLIFARSDDTKFDQPRSPTVQRIRSVTDGKGALLAYDHRCAAGWPTDSISPAALEPSKDGNGTVDPFAISGADHWYDSESQRICAIRNDLVHTTLLPGYLRSVAPGYTTWAVETHIDELAHALGRDPAEYRLALLSAKGRNGGAAPHAVGGANRLRAVLEWVLERSGWSNRHALPSGKGMGLALGTGQEREMPTWIATVAQVAVDGASGTVKVEKLTSVFDAGTLAHPDGAMAQAEGSVLWGLSLAMFEGTEYQKGLPRDLNLDSYTPVRMTDVPELDIEFLRNDHMPVGLGEPGVISVAPAIGNAIFAAVGARVRDLPIRPEAVRAAMGA
ncbi:molybdopterin-dependent oxidoreductase (plasmid) [Methylobacterium sp. NMS14P]|uniref:xanthine dehydrogenase family protein molybdopterin-binding subunit n=1 Tax=Methylobacterium sp. NMS14P TaxID=2894310 RepID=UPI0023586CE7|nr:molybdopterin cofactor-binding domain-containing protein [Methylobacterium sp. NMS14P]WCS28575.1 molybdopterin-dependent oxidoreductase [Methylobacterium sp. NMS14P]